MNQNCLLGLFFAHYNESNFFERFIMIKRKGKLIECPKCKSIEVLVITVRDTDYGSFCEDCGEKFLTGHPIIEGHKDLWNHPGDTAEWLSRGPKG